MSNVWAPVDSTSEVFEGKDRKTGTVKFTATRNDLVLVQTQFYVPCQKFMLKPMVKKNCSRLCCSMDKSHES